MDATKFRVSTLLCSAILGITLLTPSNANVPPIKPSNVVTANVGTLKGDFHVTPTGQAHYTIPIDVPPGTAKMQPALSIAYDSTSSNTRNGPLGMGFSIEGLTTITRCQSNKTQNNGIRGVDFSYQDRFCLNGEQLVAVKGAYGGDGTEYRTYIDSKAKIVSYGHVGAGPISFKVWTKGGQVATYGGTPDSQIYAVGQPTVATWALNQITDSTGNYLNVRYSKDDANGAFYPIGVDYTGNVAAGTAPYYSVAFSYEARPDKYETYTFGSIVRILQRLKTIQIKTLPAGQIISSYNFTYETSPNSFRSRITSIEKCSMDGVCLPPTKFTWQKNDEGWDKAPQYKPSILSSIIGGEFVNLTGTGVQEFVRRLFIKSVSAKVGDPERYFDAWINTGKGWLYDAFFIPPFEISHSESEKYGTDAGTRFVDLRGSGYDDIIQSTFMDSTLWRSDFYLNDGSKWSKDPNYKFKAPVEFAYEGGDAGTRFIHLTGSGLPDLVKNAAEDGVGAWINTGHAWQVAPAYMNPPLEIANYQKPGDFGTRFIDLRGLGLDDQIEWGYMGDKDQRRAAYLNTGNGWAQDQKNYLPPAEIANLGRDEGVRFIHLSTSGLLDVVQSAFINRNNIKNGAWINTGNGWLPNNDYALPSDIGTSFGVHIVNFEILGADYGMVDTGVRFVDLRGTGLDDLVQHAAYSSQDPERHQDILVFLNYTTYINNGYKWQADDKYNLPTTSYSALFGDSGLRFVDLTGSGLPDIVKFGLLSNGAWFNKAQKYPDYLISVTDGLGAKLDIDYEALSIKNPDIKVYTKEHTAQYPYMDYQGPMYVVYKTTTTANISDPKAISRALAKNNNSPDALEHVTYYHYIGAKMHHLGFGFLGFHQIVTTDQSTGISKTVTYGQDVATHNIGEELGSETRLSNNTLIASSQNTWESRAFGDGSPNNTYYQNNTKQIISKTFDLNGVLLNTKTEDFVVDDYGNATKMTTTLQDNTGTYITTNENGFKNDTTAWLLGALQTSVVTATAPNKPTNKRTAYFTYDPATGLLLHEESSPDNDTYKTAKDYTRDKFGNIVKTVVSGTKIESRTSTVVYDANGRFVTQATNPLGQSTFQTFDAVLGVMTQVTDLNGNPTKYQYDGFGRLVETDYPDGTQEAVNYTWSPGGCNHVYFATTTKTNAPTKVVYFDNLNRPVATTTQGLSGQLIWQLTQYDELGRITKQSIPYFSGVVNPLYINTDYDVLGHKTKITNPDNSTTTFSYSGSTTTITNDLKQKVIKTYDARNNLIAVTDNLNHTTHYDYDAYGNLVTLTDSTGNVTKIVYDQYGRKTDVYDPDKGHWSYTYDALGQLITQSDAFPAPNTHVTKFEYDRLGRMISRTDPAGTSTWEYDHALHGIGKLFRVTGVANSNGQPADLNTIQKARHAGLGSYSKTFVYDNLSRPQQVITAINGQTYTSAYTYDQDRVATETYPNGISVKRNYNAYGYLVSLSDVVQPQKIYWTLNSMDALGHVISETHSNGLITNYTYDAKTNLLTDINTVLNTNLELQKSLFPKQTGLTAKHQHVNPGNHANKNSLKINALQNGAIQSEQYGYDSIGNVVSHKDNVNNLTESYQFDGLNRISQATIGTDTQTYQYDDIGNIIYKSDVGTYTYSKANAGSHAVTSINGKLPATFTYNANGDQTDATINGVKRHITYTSFSKPLEIVTNGLNVSFLYDADRNSFERDDYTAAKHITTYYLGDYEVAKIDNGKTIVTEQKAYIGSSTINITRLGSGDSKNDGTTIYEVLHNNLGSTTDIVDQNANIVQHFSYTPFGEQKQTKGQVLDHPITHKGFTGHEEIEGMNLIHMGGRIYDPVIGRFLSADPTIEAPADPQDLNRYSYCINNPLKYTDASGYGFFGSLFRSISDGFQSACKFVGRLFNQETVGLILQIATGVFVPGFAPILAAALAAASGGDFVDMLKAAGFTELSIYVWGKVGSYTQGMMAGGWAGNFKDCAESTLLHGLAGGGLSCIEGGGFKDGFLAAAVGEACSGCINDLPSFGNQCTYDLERVTAASIIGGTAAAISGGNFANGAETAAFEWMFNHIATESYSWCAEREAYDVSALGLSPEVAADDRELCEIGQREGLMVALVAAGGGGASEAEVAATRVFWSGGGVARAAAEEWAVANGGVTLEMTRAGQQMAVATRNMSWNQAEPMWKGLSADFAAGASGDAHVFLNTSSLRSGSVWETIEKPTLLNNENIRRIIEHHL